MGCHFLLRCRKVKSESEVAQSCPTPSDPVDCSLPGSSIHGIFQATVLEWGAIAFYLLTNIYSCFLSGAGHFLCPEIAPSLCPILEFYQRLPSTSFMTFEEYLDLIFIWKILKSIPVLLLPFLHYISGFSRLSYQPFNEIINLRKVQETGNQLRWHHSGQASTIQIRGMK